MRVYTRSHQQLPIVTAASIHGKPSKIAPVRIYTRSHQQLPIVTAASIHGKPSKIARSDARETIHGKNKEIAHGDAHESIHGGQSKIAHSDAHESMHGKQSKIAHSDAHESMHGMPSIIAHGGALERIHTRITHSDPPGDPISKLELLIHNFIENKTQQNSNASKVDLVPFVSPPPRGSPHQGALRTWKTHHPVGLPKRRHRNALEDTPPDLSLIHI